MGYRMGGSVFQAYHGRPDTLAPFIDNDKLNLYIVPRLEIAYQPSAHAGSPSGVYEMTNLGLSPLKMTNPGLSS
jgi:hypothetical protein